MKKRSFLSNFLFGILLSYTAFGQYNPTTNTYTLQDKDVTISNGIITACSTTATDWGTGKLIIPETLQGQTVLEIAGGNPRTTSGIFTSKGITELQLSTSLQRIGINAFRNNAIEVLVFKENCKLRYIGGSAFYSNKLTNLVIPRMVSVIGESAFGVNKLTSVTFEPKSFIRVIVRDAFASLLSLTLPSNANPGFKGYNSSDFGGIGVTKNIDNTITNLRKTYFADLPAHILTSEDVLFSNNKITGVDYGGYSNIIVPDNIDGETIKTLGGFWGIYISSIKLSNSVDSILDYAFSEDLYSEITIPSNLKYTGEDGISAYNPTAMKVLFNENSSLTFIDKLGFDCMQRSVYTLPSDVIKEGYTFTGWKNSKGATVTSITDRMLTYTAQFTPTTSYTVSGKITSNNTAGLHLVLSGDFKGYRYTNSDGSFSFPLNAGRNMVLTPEKEGYIFTPTSRTIINLQAAASNLDFTATPTGTCVSGTIDIDDKNMWLQVSGDVTCAVKLQADGTYTLPLNIGRSVTIMPVKDGYVFTPQSITVNNVQSCVSGINFTTKTSTTITQQIPLEKGWNLVSVNLLPDNAGGRSFPIATLFAGLDVETIKTVDSFWTKDQADALNRLKTITTGEGYLVKMNAAGTLHLTGVANQSGVTIPNAAGWMLIGCPYQVEKPLSSLFTSANCTAVKSFEGHWQPAGSLNSIQSIEPGKAYFIKK